VWGTRVATANAMIGYKNAGSPEIPVVFSEQGHFSRSTSARLPAKRCENDEYGRPLSFNPTTILSIVLRPAIIMQAGSSLR
jgi:hypothetical protein